MPSLLMFLIGLLTGFMSGLLGVGGGFILVPLLVMFGIPTKVAIGSSLAYIAFTGLSGFAIHYRQGNCNLMLGLTAISGGILAAQLGAQITTYAEARALEVLLGLLLLGFSILLYIRKKPSVRDAFSPDDSARQGAHHARMRIYSMSFVIGTVIGLFTGLLGVGGGFLFVPLMVIVLHVPIYIAIGTSLLYVVSTAISGAIRHWTLGQIDLLLVFILVMGGITGAPVGAMITRKLPSRTLTGIFVVILFTLGIKLLIG